MYTHTYKCTSIKCRVYIIIGIYTLRFFAEQLKSSVHPSKDQTDFEVLLQYPKGKVKTKSGVAHSKQTQAEHSIIRIQVVHVH